MAEKTLRRNVSSSPWALIAFGQLLLDVSEDVASCTKTTMAKVLFSNATVTGCYLRVSNSALLKEDFQLSYQTSFSLQTK
jgi:hypothetical protein